MWIESHESQCWGLSQLLLLLKMRCLSQCLETFDLLFACIVYFNFDKSLISESVFSSFIHSIISLCVIMSINSVKRSYRINWYCHHLFYLLTRSISHFLSNVSEFEKYFSFFFCFLIFFFSFINVLWFMTKIGDIKSNLFFNGNCQYKRLINYIMNKWSLINHITDVFQSEIPWD